MDDGGAEVERLAVPDRESLPAGSVDQLLHQTAEEEEMEVKGLNTSGDMDFLILDEEQGDSNETSAEPLTEGADTEEPFRTSTPKLSNEEASKGDNKSAEGGDDVGASTVSSNEEEAKEEAKKAADVKAVESDEKQDSIVEIQDEEPGKSEEEPEKCADEKPEEVEEVVKEVVKNEEEVAEEPPAQVAEELAEAEKSLDSSDDVQVVAIEQPEFVKQEVTEEDKELDSSTKENKMPVSNGAGIAVSVSCFKDEDPDDPDPTEGNADDVDSKPPKRSASSHGILADLKRALNMIDVEAGNPKRFKLDMNDDGNELDQEDGADPPEALSTAASASTQSVGLPVGPNLVVLSRKQLEQYVARRVRECLVTQATALLQPMEKKCDTLHRALERWRRRSFQLQKQLNEFVCEQEKCANARRSRRSVGVCVRMPPVKPPVQTPGSPNIKTIPTTVTAPTSVVSRAPNVTVSRGPYTTVSTVASSGTSPAHPASPAQQIRVTGTNASMLAALQSAPTSSTPVSSPVPVPMQLIANTANMTASQSPTMKVVTTSSSTGTPVRTVAVVSSASSSTSSAPGVKIIDLTQEEEAANAQAKALSAAAGSFSLGTALHKIAVSSSSIPVLSAAPTSLVQVQSGSNPTTSRVSIAGTSVVLSHMTGGTVTQAGTNAVRLSSSSIVGPPTRVTYLVPSLPPGMVVTPREAGPRLATGSGPQPMQTILLRMATPTGGFTTVPGGAIAMPTGLLPANASGGPAGTPSGATTMMVATAAGSQVRMVRAPPPMTLPRGGTTLTLPPGTTLVRAPLASSMRPGVPQQMSVVRPPVPTASTAATTPNLSLPPKPTLQVQVPGAPVRLPQPSQPSLQVQVPGSNTTVQPAKPDASVTIIKAGAQQHPASLPPTPRYIDDPKKKRLPPKPALKITKAASGEKADNSTTVHKVPPAKKCVVVKREEAEPKPPTAEDMEKVLEQWQTFLDNKGGDDKEDGNKEQGRRRLPYHTQRPLRHACLCRLGTCRYDKLQATFKERLHANFGRLEPTQQLRLLLGRMYTKGKGKRNKKACKEEEDPSTAAARKGRCKWVYWLPASGGAQPRRKVCKAAFMAVHGITEKRTRDVQLLWMRLKAKRGRTPTGDESDVEQEELMPGTYTDIDDEDEESAEKQAVKPARKPRRARKVLRVSESEDSEAADNVTTSVKSEVDDVRTPENGSKKVVKPPSLGVSEQRGVSEQSTRPSQEDDEMEGDDEADDDEDDVPYLDMSGFEPICALEEDSENLVLSLPRGVFGEDEEDTGAA
uniref:Activating transcription factor 7 n=1 Tax=Rhipicephalus appendiculatus TaxID=34631 RepID=A0A131YWA6_RHIAP